MSKLNVVIGEAGVERIWSSVSTVSDGRLSAELLEVASLGLRLTNDAVRDQFNGEPATGAKPLPAGEHDLYRCLCGEVFTSADKAIRHVEKNHASARIRRDIDKLEVVIEGMVTPNPLPPALEPTEIVKDQTFGVELQEELTKLFADLGDQVNVKAEQAAELIRYCDWDKIAGLNLDEVKVAIRDEPGDKKIPLPLHEAYLTAIASFLNQVGKLSKYGDK